MILDQGTQPPAFLLVEAVHEGHAVGIADRDGGHRQAGAVAELQRDGHDVPVRPVHWNLGRPERRASHLDRDEAHASALDAALALNDAALRVDREGRLLGPAALPEILREDPEPITRLLRFTAVRVEDAQPEVSPRGGNEQEDAVGAHAPVAIADPLDRLLGEWSLEILLLHHDVVVAEAMAFCEGDHGRVSSTRRPLAAET